jgi:hypothetical protein
VLQPSTLNEVIRLSTHHSEPDRPFHIDDALWTRVVFEFSCAYAHNRIARGQLLQSLTPLYLGRVASFVKETEMLVSAEVEQRIEHLCLTYERLKPYLIALWNHQQGGMSPAGDLSVSSTENRQTHLEARNV